MNLGRHRISIGFGSTFATTSSNIKGKTPRAKPAKVLSAIAAQSDIPVTVLPLGCRSHAPSGPANEEDGEQVGCPSGERGNGENSPMRAQNVADHLYQFRRGHIQSEEENSDGEMSRTPRHRLCRDCLFRGAARGRRITQADILGFIHTKIDGGLNSGYCGEKYHPRGLRCPG